MPEPSISNYPPIDLQMAGNVEVGIKTTKYPLESLFAWLVVMQGFIGASLTFGPIFSYGIFLEVYVEQLNINVIESSLIGALGLCKYTSI